MRKNFLFSNTAEEAESSAIFFSILQSSLANNVNPLEYISYLIKKLNNGCDNFEELLPWKYKNQAD